MSEMIAKVARAIAKRHGDDFDAIPRHKSDWTEHRGHFGGRFRDVNEPYQVDYEDMAQAAIEAMREPTQELREGVMQASLDCVPIERCEQQALQVWQNTIDAILEPTSKE